MNIKVNVEDFLINHTADTGGECAVAKLEISVDKNLPIRTQRALVRHAIIENFNRGLPHDKVELLCELLQEGEDLLGVNDEV